MTHDVRDRIFESLSGRRFAASIVAAEDGIVAGVSGALSEAMAVGCTVHPVAADGEFVEAGATLIELIGSPKELAMAEECVIGALAKPSGIATATRSLVDAAGPHLQIVGGGWKKMPGLMREMVRHALSVGGAHPAIDETPFLYLDKNYVRMFGGVAATLKAVDAMTGFLKVIQIGDNGFSLEEETRTAVQYGASTVFVDTGDMDDLSCVIDTLEKLSARDRVRVAFGGGVQLEHIDDLVRLGVDALCIGRAIVDAPLLDMRMEITTPKRKHSETMQNAEQNKGLTQA